MAEEGGGVLWKDGMNGNESMKSFGELPTLGRGEPSEPKVRAGGGVSWHTRNMEAETLRPPEGIRDDGRTDAARRWTPGETILDRYVVERELGQGGMGVVYGCLDRVGGVRVAVKCLPPELSHNSVEMEEVRENFQLVYGLSHPNIAGARYLERDGSGVYYLVMEEAAGENLRRWLRTKWKAGGVTLAEAVGILRQVAAALDYAHGEKVIHRDVKPGNVMIDARGRVKVLDFGLASQIRTSLSRASHAYRGTSGTGPYMAPEQWRGRRQDGKTDQYALGVMAYEMLAGHLPFENDEVSVLREVVLKEEPEDIPGVPEGAMAAIRRAMSKNAAERFPTCGAFVDALESTASQGRASTPCEPENGKAAGAVAGKSDGKPAGRTARPEGSPHHHRKGRSTGGWVASAVVAAGVVAGVWGWREHTELGEGPWSAGRAWRAGDAVEETARPEGSPHQQTAEEAEAARMAEEERLAAERAAEEKRLAEQRKKEEEAARLEAERVRAAREEQIRQESEALEETVYRLAPMARTKAEDAAKAGYDREDGFGKRLDAAQEKLGQGEAAMQGRNFGKAKEYFEASMAAADWCAENAPLREAAKSAAGAVLAAKKKADGMDAAHLALRSYNRASDKATEGQDAFGSARFKEATAAWNAAVEGYGQAEQEARAEKVRQGLVAAQGAERREAWEDVLSAAENVLVLEGGNAEALRLKAAAEGHFKPILVVSATLREGGASRPGEPGAQLKIGSKTYTLPQPFDCSAAATFGPGTVTLEKDGKTFAGTLARMKVDWKGEKQVAVPLEAVLEAARPEGSPHQAGDMKTITLPGGAKMKMVWCPAGSFMMGSPSGEKDRCDDETQHRVTLTEGFWMANTEVTQKQWESVMGTTVRQQRDKANSSWSLYGEGDDYPMYYVSWDEAQEFCQKAGHDLQLPTEAQWEYACRAGSTGAYGGTGDLGTMGWYTGNRGTQTHPVGTKQRNAWGLYDMHGNVWEWCADWYTKDLGTRAVTNPTGPGSGSGRVGRGGGWYNYAKYCRSAFRDNISSDIRHLGLGFRPVSVRP